ncbi:MAG: DUF1223 domain-containing protein [Beijerinckiaceae bacterium]
MKSLISIAIAAIAATTVPALAQGEVATRPRAVIELFTSQGCSSCPPADKLMGELARDPSIIVVSLPVDYWDYLGWRDTLASPAFTQRQKAYSAMRGDRQVYTPQAVINGASHAVGSERGAIDKAIHKSRDGATALTTDVAVEKTETGINVRIGAHQGGNGHVWLMPIIGERTVQIGRGENSGRSIVYVNVVRAVTRLSAWSGEATIIHVPRASIPSDCEGVVVLLQAGTDKKPGQVLGAARRMGL